MMRVFTKSIAALVICTLLASLSGMTGGSFAYAEGNREVARKHYQAGLARWKAGDLHGAILELAAADAIVPAAVLSYDIAICHDKLGERAEAARRYREYLMRRPDAPNRRDVEARLAVLAPEQPYQAPPGEYLPTRPPPTPDGLSPPRSLDEPTRPPSDAAPRRVPYDETYARRLPGERAGEQAGNEPPVAVAPVPQLPSGQAQPAPAPVAPVPEPAKSTPFYKKWWFWVFVGVGAIIVIDIASHDDSPSTSTIEGAVKGAGPKGLTLCTF